MAGLLDGFMGPDGRDARQRMAIGLMGLTHNPNQQLMQMWGGEVQQRQQTKAEAEKINKTAQYLRSLGTSQAMQAAAALEAGTIDANTAYQEATKPAPQADPWAGTKEIGGNLYRMGANGPELVLDTPDAAGGGVTYGLTPQRYKRPDGTIGFGVLGTDGTFKEVALPDGAQPAPNVDKIDAGDRWLLIDQTGAVIGEQPKNLEAAAAAGERGKAIGAAEGAAITGASSAISKAEETVRLIDDVIKDPALPSVTGMIQGRLPAMPLISGGQAGTNLNVKIEQLKGKAFLEAYNMLRGAGAITEQEGQAATAAFARLNQAQDAEAYKAALSDLRNEVTKLMEIAKAKAAAAGGAGSAPQATAPRRGVFNPTTGQVEWN